MMCVHFGSFTGFTVHHSSTATFFPLALAFLYSAVTKSLEPTSLGKLSIVTSRKLRRGGGRRNEEVD